MIFCITPDSSGDILGLVQWSLKVFLSLIHFRRKFTFTILKHYNFNISLAARKAVYYWFRLITHITPKWWTYQLSSTLQIYYTCSISVEMITITLSHLTDSAFTMQAFTCVPLACTTHNFRENCPARERFSPNAVSTFTHVRAHLTNLPRARRQHKGRQKWDIYALASSSNSSEFPENAAFCASNLAYIIASTLFDTILFNSI